MGAAVAGGGSRPAGPGEPATDQAKTSPDMSRRAVRHTRQESTRQESPVRVTCVNAG